MFPNSILAVQKGSGSLSVLLRWGPLSSSKQIDTAFCFFICVGQPEANVRHRALSPSGKGTYGVTALPVVDGEYDVLRGFAVSSAQASVRSSHLVRRLCDSLAT